MTNAPAIFWRAQNSFFACHLDLNIVVYMDDILTYGKIQEEHKKYLKEVFICWNKIDIIFTKEVFFLLRKSYIFGT